MRLLSKRADRMDGARGERFPEVERAAVAAKRVESLMLRRHLPIHSGTTVEQLPKQHENFEGV